MTLRVVGWAAVSSGAQAEDDKISIPYQIERINEIVKSNGWQLIDLIVVPGFSRDYFSYEEFASDAYKDPRNPIRDPVRLLDHWQNKSFDLFMYYDGSRFGRTQSILSQVIERSFFSGARLYSMQMNRILEPSEMRFYIATEGLRAAGELDELKRRYQMGMKKRAESGLPSHGYQIRSHTLIRDAKGKALRLEVDESQRRLWDDVFDLLVNHQTSFGTLESCLIERGHTMLGGIPLRRYTIHRMMLMPTFWGHAARKHATYFRTHGRRANWSWVYRDDLPAPPDVIMYRNRLPAVYTGDQRLRLIAELERRQSSVMGRNRPYASERYSGLFFCGGCGYAMHYMTRRYKPTGASWKYLYCQTPSLYDNITCTSRKAVRVEQIDAYIDKMVKLIFSAPDIDTALESLGIEPQPDIQPRLARLAKEIASLEEQARRTVANQTRADPALMSIYDEQLAAIGVALANARAARDQLERSGPRRAGRRRTVAEMKQIGYDKFWTLSDVQINQFLHGIMEELRFVIVDGKITELTDEYTHR